MSIYGQLLMAQHFYYRLWYKSPGHSLCELFLISTPTKMAYSGLLWPCDKPSTSERSMLQGDAKSTRSHLDVSLHFSIKLLLVMKPEVHLHLSEHYADISTGSDSRGFPRDDGKVSACNVGDPGSIPGLGRCPGEGNGNPLQHSCLENPMDKGAW